MKLSIRYFEIRVSLLQKDTIKVHISFIVVRGDEYNFDVGDIVYHRSIRVTLTSKAHEKKRMCYDFIPQIACIIILFCDESISLRWAKDKEGEYQFAILNRVSLHLKGEVKPTTSIVICSGHAPLFDNMGIRFSSIVVCGYEMGQLCKNREKKDKFV